MWPEDDEDDEDSGDYCDDGDQDDFDYEEKMLMIIMMDLLKW